MTRDNLAAHYVPPWNTGMPEIQRHDHSPKQTPAERQARYDEIRRRIVREPDLSWDGFADFKRPGLILTYAQRELEQQTKPKTKRRRR